jgi:hypothetical protein
MSNRQPTRRKQSKIETVHFSETSGNLTGPYGVTSQVAVLFIDYIRKVRDEFIRNTIRRNRCSNLRIGEINFKMDVFSVGLYMTCNEIFM